MVPLHEAAGHVLDARRDLVGQMVMLGAAARRARNHVARDRMFDVLAPEHGVARERALASLLLSVRASAGLLLLRILLVAIAIAIVRRDPHFLALASDEIALELRDLRLQREDAGLVRGLALGDLLGPLLELRDPLRLLLELRDVRGLLLDDPLLLLDDLLLARDDLAEAALDRLGMLAPGAVMILRKLHEDLGSHRAIRVDPLRARFVSLRPRRAPDPTASGAERDRSIPSSSIARSVASSVAVREPSGTRGIRKRPCSSRL